MNTMAIWFATFAVHAGVLLALAFCLDRALPPWRRAWRETLWRAALFGAMLTTTAQLLSPHAAAVARWALPPTEPIATSAPAASMPQRTSAPPNNELRSAAPTLDVRAARAGGAALPVTTVAPALPTTPAAAPALPPQRGWTLPHAWATWLLAAWLAGCLLALARVAMALVALRRELRAATPVDDPALDDMLAALCARAGLWGVALFSADLASPIAVSRRRIVVPTWALSALERQPLRAMLAHELGHLVRRDPAWKIATALMRALLWFLPPAAWAQRRLDALAELACDDFAAQHTGAARDLAECLATCAEYHLHGPAPALAAAMAAPRSALVFRIERLLEGAYVDTSASGAVARSLAMLALTASVFCLPAIGVEAVAAPQASAQPAAAVAGKPAEPARDGDVTVAAPGRAAAAQVAASARAASASAAAGAAAKAGSATAATTASSGHSSVSVRSDDDGHDTLSISLSDDQRKFSARVDGKIEFDDAETDVAAIPGGSATFEETRAGVRRRVDVVDHGGKLERRWYVDGSERPYDDDARAFMARVVRDVVRSGVGADARAKRLYRQGGADRVLDEIAQIPTDYVRRLYLTALFGLGKLTPAQSVRTIELAGALGSDYERRQALDALFATQALDAESQVAFLRQALRFDSDYERAELLVGVLPRLADSAAVHQALLDAALQIKSDYEHRRTLQAMLARGGLDDAQIARVIEASAAMNSDYEHRELLVDAAQRLRNPDAVAATYAASARRISSDYERREALLALLQSGRVGAAGARAILDAAAELHSDYECRQVLVALARVMPSDAALLARYREVAGRMSDYERGEAERALVR